MPREAGDCRQLWLFDIDGTLVAPSADQLAAWVSALGGTLGVEVSPAAITPYLGRTFAEIVHGVAAAAGRPLAPSRIPEALAAYTCHVRQALARRPAQLLPGAREVLDFLRTQGNLVGVVTGNFREEGEMKLEGVGLHALLDLTIYADLATPAREVLVRRAAAEAKVFGFDGDPADIIVVGDSVHDVVGARRTGARAVAVCTGLTPRALLEAVEPDLLVPDLPHLLADLRRTNLPWSRITRSG